MDRTSDNDEVVAIGNFSRTGQESAISRGREQVQEDKGHCEHPELSNSAGGARSDITKRSQWTQPQQFKCTQYSLRILIDGSS